MKNKQPKKTALYCRLSVDDGRLGESVSIESQKILLVQYCKDHAIKNYKIYDDDGYSGTNFNRPGFINMYDDIQKGLIDTVIVKDQSRFGRSYIDVGMYVEQFKDRGVRFIAVDDCYDSSQGEYDMMFPMRNVINEYYAREASKKTRSAKNAKAKAGQFIAAKAPFGYKLDPNDRHHLIVDEPAAEVVRRIFTLASQGSGFTRIAKILREEKVLTPIAYFNMLFIETIEQNNYHNAEIYNSLRNTLISVSASDEFFEEKLRGPVYDDNSGATRFILCMMAMRGMTRENVQDLWRKTNSNQYVWSIEHIFPQGSNIPDCWVKMIADGDHDKAKEYQSLYVHTFGNLTITGYNSTLSNKSFAEKKERKDNNGHYIGYRNGLNLNDDVCDCESDFEKCTRFVTCFIGMVPICMVILPLVLPIVAGIPLMLFFSKIKRFGMFTLFC